jgi:hypothetical protein
MPQCTPQPYITIKNIYKHTMYPKVGLVKETNGKENKER